MFEPLGDPRPVRRDPRARRRPRAVGGVRVGVVWTLLASAAPLSAVPLPVVPRPVVAPSVAPLPVAATRAPAPVRPRDEAAAALAALNGFADQPEAERLARAELLVRALPPEAFAAALVHLSDPAPAVRAALVPLLARPDLDPDGDTSGSAVSLPLRVARLGEVAASDPDPAPRHAARRALGDLDDAGAAAALARLARTGRPGEREHAAASLPATPRSAAAVRGLVRAGLGLPELGLPELGPAADPDGGVPPVAPEVLALALAAHGRILADARLTGGAGALTAAERAELLLALAHPHPLVARAAARGFDALLRRLAEQADTAAATALLADLAAAGLDPRVAAFQSVRIALAPGADLARAEAGLAALAVALGRGVGGAAAAGPDEDGDPERLWAYRAAQLEAAVALAAADAPRARRATERAALALDALLALRLDRSGERARAAHMEALVARALVEVTAILAELAAGEPDGPLPLVARARTAHTLLLEAQVLAADVLGQALGGFDPLLEDDLSPLRLVYQGRGFGPGRLDVESLLAHQARLGALLATVAPRELPGFEPLADLALGPEWTDPEADPRRSALLAAVLDAGVEGARRALAAGEERTARERQRGSLVLPEALLRENEDAQLWLRLALMDLEDESPTARLELRVPASLALSLASDLAGDGRASEARILAGRFRQDLERVGISRRWFYAGHERVVRALMQIGAAFTDEGKAVEAEATLQEAVARIEDVERQLAERGAGAAALADLRRLRASALVSLAVNANVRLDDQPKALAYYEQAYALRQDEFMTALLACYRARSGREAEARALLRRVRPGPGTWYNLACAHALLGDATEALDFLERELRENHGSAGSRARQLEWARADPDLASLRGDPRFEHLTDPATWQGAGPGR